MKTYILKNDDEKYFIKETKLSSDLQDAKLLAGEPYSRILGTLSKKPLGSEALAKAIKLNRKRTELAAEKLDKAGLIKTEEKGSRKNYSLDVGAISFELSPGEEKFDVREKRIKERGTSRFYDGILKEGRFDGYICVGSPDPHGEYKAIARDTHYAMYLSMFFGQFVDFPGKPPTVLDTDVISKNLFKNNLIVIGGPVTNLVTREINSYLPVKFVKEEGWGLKFKDGIHTRDYEGVIQKIKNPFDKSKEIIVLAGIRNVGTLAVMLASTKFSNTTFAAYDGEKPWSALVRGYDIDGDGEIDSVETVR